MPLNIPHKHVETIFKIGRLSDLASEELISALSNASLASESGEMAAQIAQRVPSIPIADLTSIVSTVYSLYYVREFAEVRPSTFLKDLIAGLRESSESEVTFSADDLKVLRERLKRLLSIEELQTLSKAVRLQREGERLYCEAKILSDIRPVFAKDISTRPSGAVITHTLKLSYHEGKDHKEFFVVLDKEDLDALKEVVDRANAKGETLRGLLSEANLPDLGA